MKRKNVDGSIQEQQEDDLLDLSLSLPSYNPPSNPPNTNPSLSSNPSRVRRNPTPSRVRSEGSAVEVKSKTVPAPYPWATEQRATVHSMKYLLDNEIHTISGQVQCKKCDKSYTLDYSLQEKFQEVGMFIVRGQDEWHNRAPEAWTDPNLPTCKLCGEVNSCKPLISEKKRSINWLFLLLGQFLGCCTLGQLKYFCKHTKLHRTGAKNRLIYLSYFALCKQLDPNGPFN